MWRVRKTYMSCKAFLHVVGFIRMHILFTSNNLKNYNSKTKYIWFFRELSKHCIFRRHITTEKENSRIISCKIVKKINELKIKTYYVPTIRSVSARFWSISTILANPKSDILGFIFSSNKILLRLRSRWIILSREYSCK